jgi:hypothetical protein
MRRSNTWPALLASSVNLPHAPRLEVLREFVALSVLDGGPVVELLLLGRREVGKVFARHLELDPARDLHRAGGPE